jgi:hypothetical protein
MIFSRDRCGLHGQYIMNLMLLQVEKWRQQEENARSTRHGHLFERL